MPRAATTADVFNAIAEPRRRALIDLLAGGQQQAVGELVSRLRIAQPDVSKHLGVLRKVGIVSMNKNGRQRLYRLNSAQLKPVYDWVKTFEPYWSRQLDRIKERAEQRMQERNPVSNPPNRKKGPT